jgi:coproporphyrinogen III oxidase-like Fe-S oxidoreductase
MEQLTLKEVLTEKPDNFFDMRTGWVYELSIMVKYDKSHCFYCAFKNLSGATKEQSKYFDKMCREHRDKCEDNGDKCKVWTIRTIGL